MTHEQRASLLEAVAIYNRGNYFESQEVLEDLHNACAEDDRDLAKSLTMIACGMHIHFRRGGGRGALNLFRQALIILDDLRPQSEGIATDALYEELFAYLEELQERKKPGAGFFDRWLAPRIRQA